jgi:hypothetical protein
MLCQYTRDGLTDARLVRLIEGLSMTWLVVIPKDHRVRARLNLID